MTNFDNLEDYLAQKFAEYEQRFHNLEHGTPQNSMSLTGTIRLAGDGRIVIPWGSGSASLAPTLANVNGRMQPGGDMHSWATSISSVANSAHGVATGAANSLAPGGATHNWISQVSGVANAANTSAGQAWSRAGTAISNAAAAQSAANGAAGTASSALSAANEAQEMVRTLRRQVRDAGVAVPA